jgi:hypothetical protein
MSGYTLHNSGSSLELDRKEFAAHFETLKVRTSYKTSTTISKLHRIALPTRPTLHLRHVSSVSAKQNAELRPQSNYAPRSVEDYMLKKLGPPPTFNKTGKMRVDVLDFGHCSVNFELAGCEKE